MQRGTAREECCKSLFMHIKSEGTGADVPVSVCVQLQVLIQKNGEGHEVEGGMMEAPVRSEEEAYPFSIGRTCGVVYVMACRYGKAET